MGIDYDAYARAFELAAIADEGVYLNAENYARYTDNKDATTTHAVTVIGWDDTYSASNFLEGHQPPADGAMKESTATANVFEMAQDNILSYVGVLTADKSTSVTVKVYLLNENATSPVDGTMLDVVTGTYLYGGYHRIALSYNYAVPAGSKVSVVQVQRVTNGSDTVYAVPYAASFNRLYMDAQNVFELEESRKVKTWFEGRIGTGESFVCLDDAWTDWGEVIASLNESSKSANYFSYDNLNIKLYAYSLEDLQTLHGLSEPIVFNGVHAQVCEDCGYTIVEQ